MCESTGDSHQYSGDQTSTDPSGNRDANEMKRLKLIMLTDFLITSSSVLSSSSYVNVGFDH